MACSANKKLVVFIVDDEPGPLQTLANDLKEMPEVGEVCTFSSYNDAVYPLITKQPDVVFLDVEVPGKSGLDFSETSVRAYPSPSMPCSTRPTAIT